MDIQSAKKIYCIGIGGIGLSALAEILLTRGKEVYGSDATHSAVIEKLQSAGAKVKITADPEDIPKDTDLIIYSAAVPEDHKQRQKARQALIPEIVYPQALGQLLRRAELSIAVSGTNGKTTTTAMIGLLLEAAGLDPTVIVGSVVKQWGSNARAGKNNVMVVEACEHKAHMLHLQPNVIVLTNIEEDHLDFYKDIRHIQATFEKYIKVLPQHGWLFLNNDDEISREKLKRPQTQIRTFGIDRAADTQGKNIVYLDGKQNFEWWFQEKYIDDIDLQVPGKFNVANAMASISVGTALGIETDVIKKSLENFAGTWRRFETVGQWQGARIISDYAHHPTALEQTLRATKEMYGDRRDITVFQPHQHNRTKKLFTGFVESLLKADNLIIPEIFHVEGREDDSDVSSKDLVEAITKKGTPAVYAADLSQTEKILKKTVQAGDVILMMGAGDIYTLAEKLCQKKS